MARKAPKVLTYLQANPNRILTADNLWEAVGAEHKNRVAMLQCMSRLVRDGHVERLADGVFRYNTSVPKQRPAPEPVTTVPARDRMLFEEIGRASNGDIIIESTDHKLYRATEL